MNVKRDFKTNFLFILLVATLVLSFFVLKPFLIALTIAFVLSQLFKNQYKKLYRRLGKRASLASGLLCFFIFFVIFVPLVAALGLMGSEINKLYDRINQNELPGKISMVVKNLPLKEIGINFDTSGFQSALKSGHLLDSAKSISNLFFQVIKKTYQGATQFFFMIFVMFFSLYYLFKEDDKIIRRITDLSPLKNRQEHLLLDNFIAVSRATIKGTFVIALIQAILVGIILVIAGVSSPIIWAMISFILSLIPFLGSVIVMIPIGLTLIVMGSIWQGIFVIVAAIVIVSSVDNFLRPKLVEGESGLHPLLVFLSTLGGLSFFGIAGFLLGPIILAFLMTLLKIYKLEFKKELKEFNR